MKILQVAAIDFTIEKFILPLIDDLKKEGYQVEIACRCGEIGKKLEKENYKIHHIPFARNFNIFSHVRNIFRLAKLIKKEKYHCLHTHTPVISLIARLAGRIAGVPIIIYTVHGFYFHENMNRLVYKIVYYLEKIWGKYFTDYLFFVSKEDYLLALNNNFKPYERLLYFGNGVSQLRFDPTVFERDNHRKKMGISEQDIVLIFVGRIVKEKGLLELIKAFNIAKLKHNQIKLMIVGGIVEGDRDSIQIHTIINGLTDQVRKDIFLLGSRDDIPQLLSIADVFLLPSYREGLPYSILEAMAMKKPVIATDIRGCRELVFPGLNGYLCKVKDSDDLAKKLLKLLDSPQNIEIFGGASRELFLNDFNEKKVLEKQLEIYHQILAEVKDVSNN